MAGIGRLAVMAVALLACAGLQAAQASPAGSACPPAGWSVERLRALKAARFELEDEGARQVLALGLLDCLGDPDPAMRDGIAFEANSAWLRADKLDQATRLAALERLLPAIAPTAADAAGFRQPFAALVLAELARADRKAAYLSPAQRQSLVEATATYLESVTDHRGFDDVEGWRHGVAHAADLSMQLVLNPLLDKAQLDRLLAALRSQVAPPDGHAYIHGESERLARPVLLAAMRDLHSPEEWQAWFLQLASPAPLASWRLAYSSASGLARRHDTRAFLLVSHLEASQSKDERVRALLPAIDAALAAVP